MTTTMRAVPLHLSPTPVGVDITAARVGAELLGLPLTPQGEVIARVLEARKEGGERPLFRRVGVQVPRRSTKSTTIWATILGRCATLPSHRVVVTAQDRTRAANAMKEVMRTLDARYPEDVRDFKLRWSSGGESIEFPNGSRIWCVSPKPSAFRGEAADTMLFDEAGELDPEESADLVAGALPLMDTRPLGQVIIAGTPARTRAGLLWDTLEAGRAGKPGIGVVEYAATDADDPTDEDVWWRVHPGLASGLTDIDIIRERFETMPLPQFCTEYLGMWTQDPGAFAIDPADWELGAGAHADRPEHFALGFDVQIDGSSAAVVAAWRDGTGRAHVEVLEHRKGTEWLPRFVHDLVKRHRVTCAYDAIGANHEPAEVLLRQPGIPVRMKRMTMQDTVGAAALLSREVAGGNLHHPDDASLNDAVSRATWRQGGRGGRLFGRRRPGDDITCLVAASLALWTFDGVKPQTRPLVLVRTD